MTPEIYEALDFLYEFDTYEPYQEALKIIEDALQDAAIAPVVRGGLINMIKASDAAELVKAYHEYELKKQSAIAWLEDNVEKEIRTTAEKGGTWVITSVPGELYNLIKKVLEELGYKVSHVRCCQLQISWED